MGHENTSGVPLDLARLRELIELMEKHDLSEVDLQNGEERCRLRRGPQNVSVVSAPAAYSTPQVVTAPPPQTVAAPVQSAAAPKAAAGADDGTISIKSPTVGTFYTSPSPDDPPFVKVGSTVTNDSVVCLIEAMKVYNQITADVSGTIVEVLVKNGDPVEFGQPMFRLRP